MPRKPKNKPTKIAVVVNGKPVTAALHPPSGSRKSWYVYWPGLTNSKSTGCQKMEEAIVVAQDMVKNDGKRSVVSDAMMSDEEFIEIQRTHFARKTDPAAQTRAAKTLRELLSAIAAFKAISNLEHIVAATADDCARFQRESLRKLKNWRKEYPKSKHTEQFISPNTVLKWSRMLQAAYERANRSAGKRCVRGVVAEAKLLTDNPWTQFPWIEGIEPSKRRFDPTELVSILDFFEREWPVVLAAGLFAGVSLWTGARRLEVASFQWERCRFIGDEIHFDFVAKWGVHRWARIPSHLHDRLRQMPADGPYVFAAYNSQLRRHYAQSEQHYVAAKVGKEYDPTAFADWFHDKLVEWSKNEGKGHATQHVFRKTFLQFTRRGDDRNALVAADARVSATVMLRHYVDEEEEELRQKSNRTFARIVAGLPLEVAARYGHIASETCLLESQVRSAVEASDWGKAEQILRQLRDGK